MKPSLPQPFAEKMRHLFIDEAEHILESFNQKRVPSVRINTLKSSKDEMEIYFKEHNIVYKRVEGLPSALVLETLSIRELTDLPVYKEGKFYIQSLSSMLPVLILDPQAGDQILDMAAAPGSKTSQIAAYTNNQASITANDIDRKRLFKLKAVCLQLGVENITITSIPGQIIWQKYPEHFDKVLLDAPCSMEGRFDSTDKASYEHWSLKKVKNLSRLQQWLLRSAVSATKVGGSIVYSTCTISPEENEQVVNWILEKEKGNVELEEISMPYIKTIDGLTSFENHVYSSDLRKTKRIMPSNYYEGFFVAKLKKIASTVRQNNT